VCQITRLHIEDAAEGSQQPPKVLGSSGRSHQPEGEGAASTGSRPRSTRHCRAVERPVSRHVRPLLFSCGTTSVRMGIGGLHTGVRSAGQTHLGVHIIGVANVKIHSLSAVGLRLLARASANCTLSRHVVTWR
jgi:hypothetical protein